MIVGCIKILHLLGVLLFYNINNKNIINTILTTCWRYLFKNTLLIAFLHKPVPFVSILHGIFSFASPSSASTVTCTYFL